MSRVLFWGCFFFLSALNCRAGARDKAVAKAVASGHVYHIGLERAKMEFY